MKTDLIKALFLIAAVSFAYAAQTTSRVNLADLPEAAQKTVHDHLDKGKVGEIDKVVDDGDITYDVVLKKGGKARTITIDEDGQLLEMEVSLNETPEAVRAAIKQQQGSGKLEGISKVFDADQVTFEVETVNRGKTKNFTLDDSGKMLELEMSLSETPEAVQAAIRNESAGQKLGDISQVFEDGETNFEVEINPEASTRTVTIDPKGQVLWREFTIQLTDAPEEVQKTIKQLSANGRLGTITKTTEDDEISYDVEIKTDGKWDSRTIAPDGKIVG